MIQRALFLVLAVLFNTASAITVKQYLYSEAFKALTDADAYKIMQAQSGQTTLDVSYTMPGSKTVTINGFKLYPAWKGAYQGFPNVAVSAWQQWVETYKPTFTQFGFATNTTWVEDGVCFMPPRTKVNGDFVNSSTDKLLKVSFQSYSKTESGSKTGVARVVWTENGYTTNHIAGPGSSATPYWGDIQVDGARYLSACLQSLDLYQFAIQPYTSVAQPEQYIGNALRGPMSDYYLKTPTPDYSGVSIAGFAESELIAQCTQSACPNYTVPTGGGTPGTGGTGGTGGPACTLANGTTSGNPYDCAPTDSTVNCSIIDLPCNFRKAFIPSPTFLESQLPNIITKDLSLPTAVVDEIKMSVPFASTNVDVGFDFRAITMNPLFKGIVRFMCGYAVFFWLLNFFGIPNPFGNMRGSGEVVDGVNKARRMYYGRGRK